MITNDEQALKIEQYYNRGILKKEVRSYEVSLWTLQDEFITVLKWPDVEQKGRIEEPKLILNSDGIEEFTFSIPMQIYYNGLIIDNPNWYTVKDGNLIESLRKIKIIFNKSTINEKVFELLIVNISEDHKDGILRCNVKCENLAFHELGKIGYKISLLYENFEEDYLDLLKRDGTVLIASLDYWCHEAGLVQRNVESDSSREWYYKVQMNWNSFEDGADRDPSKVYEETYVTAWNSNLLPTSYDAYREKARPVSIENSNLYNITQTLAETFGVFCRYEYDYDENYHITGRNIIFYNTFKAEENLPISITYPYNSSEINRTVDSTDLTTKLFVLEAKGSSDLDENYSIMNAVSNASREDYILNFDYLKDTGAITNEQYNAIRPYEKLMRQYNNELIRLLNNLLAYLEELPQLEARKKVLENSIVIDTEQITLNTALQNALDVKDGVADGLITLSSNNPDILIVDGGIITLKNTNKGIKASTLNLYESYNASEKTLTSPITSYICYYDDNGNLEKLSGISTSITKVYATYSYDPQLYYDKVVQTWQNKLNSDEAELIDVSSKLTALETNITTVTTRIKELYDDLMPAARKKFELLMGPALREGYWQPEEYTNYGDVYSKTKNLSSPATNMTLDTGRDIIIGWDTTLFDGEDKAYYKTGINATNKNYVCINLNEVFSSGIPANIDLYSLVFNSNYVDSTDEPAATRHLTYATVGSLLLLGFIRYSSTIIPVIFYLDSKNMTTTEINYLKDTTRGRARLAIVGTTNGLINGNESSVKSIPDTAWITSSSTLSIAYPRLKCSSMELKTDSSNLNIWYGSHLLEQWLDYYINTRNTERNSDWYTEYFITLKPTLLYKYGLTQDVLINYVLSNASTAIYADAKKVSVENAYPKVSYEVLVNALNTSMTNTLYNLLALLIFINDADLKLENVFGYISQIELDLDNPENDSIEIKNYRNKFEDLFSMILAQSEAMKYNGYSYDNASIGQVGLGAQGFADTLKENKEVLDKYLDEHFNTSVEILEKLASIFAEAGEILASTSSTLGNLTNVTQENANILNSFSLNIAEELSHVVYRGEYRPETFKRGDIWIRLKHVGTSTKIEGRYIAIMDSSELKGTEDISGRSVSVSNLTAGFVRTYDGTLAAITGANLSIDAATGVIDVEAENLINLRSGREIYIAADDLVEILGNNKVNIGGTEINLCSLYEKELNTDTNSFDYRLDNENNRILKKTTGINLVAGVYNFDANTGKYLGTDAHIIIRPEKIELGASELDLKASSTINLFTSSGNSTVRNTAAISLDPEKGVYIGAGKGIRLFGGSSAASSNVYVGPTHSRKFKKGDYWVLTASVSGYYQYDGENNISYYSEYILNTTGYSTLPFELIKLWVATDSWDNLYKTAEDSPLEGTVGWEQYAGGRAEAIQLITGATNVNGASIELNSEHLLLGYSAKTNQEASNSMMEFTKEYIVMGLGDISTSSNVTGTNSGLVGAKFTKTSIGLAVEGSGGVISAILMNEKGVTVGSGTNVNAATGSLSGSYVRIAPSGVYIGSSGELKINTNDFVINSSADTTTPKLRLGTDLDWDLHYSVTYGLLIKGRVTATSLSIGNNGDILTADSNGISIGDGQLTYNSTNGLSVTGNGTFTGTINATSLNVGPESGTQLMTYSNGTLIVGSSGGTYMQYDSNGLIVKGTIYADALNVGSGNGLTMTYDSNSGLRIGNGSGTNEITYNGGSLVINGGSITINNTGGTTGTIIIGSGDNSLNFDNQGNLVIHGNITANDGTFTGTINARELHVGAQGTDCMTYGNGALTIGNYSGGKGIYYDGNDFNIQGGIVATTLTIGTNGTFMKYDATNGLNIGNGGVTYNNGVLTVNGSIYAKNLYLGTGTDDVLTGNYISASYIKFSNGVTVSLIGIDNSGNILLERVEHGSNLYSKVVLKLDDRGIMLSALSSSTDSGNTYTTSEFSLTPTGITISSGGNLTVNAAGVFTVTAGNFLLNASGDCTIGSPSGNYLQYDTTGSGSLTVKGNITATSLTIVDSNGNSAIGNWIGTYISSETIWAGVKSATVGNSDRSIKLDDHEIKMNDGNTTNLTLTNGGISMTAGVISLTGTSSLRLGSSNNTIISLSSTGITLTGLNLSLNGGAINFTSSGATVSISGTSVSIGAGTLSVNTNGLMLNSAATGSGLVIQCGTSNNSKFTVDAQGNVTIHSLMVDGESIDFSTFYNAVSISATGWSGDNLQMRARLYNKLNSDYSYAGAGVNCDASGVAYWSPYGLGYANVTIEVTIDGAGTHTFLRKSITMNVDSPFIDGWLAAAADIPDSLSGTESSIWVPHKTTAQTGRTLSLTPVYKAGWNAFYDACDGAWYEDANGDSVWRYTIPLKK